MVADKMLDRSAVRRRQMVDKVSLMGELVALVAAADPAKLEPPKTQPVVGGRDTGPLSDHEKRLLLVWQGIFDTRCELEGLIDKFMETACDSCPGCGDLELVPCPKVEEKFGEERDPLDRRLELMEDLFWMSVAEEHGIKPGEVVSWIRDDFHVVAKPRPKPKPRIGIFVSASASAFRGSDALDDPFDFGNFGRPGGKPDA